ncbi:MAG: hypothetical protein K5905_30545, partial [Roseibium sp.]|uniref:hypothetical protein n=1 Tax=Roseibium sp. TaxID=1936156 RepID=UPI00261E1AF7
MRFDDKDAGMKAAEKSGAVRGEEISDLSEGDAIIKSLVVRMREHDGLKKRSDDNAAAAEPDRNVSDEKD